MLAVVPSATLHGLDGRLIRVEVDVAPGLPGFTIVGLADTAVQEARERVRGAIRNAGFVVPAASHHGQPRARRAAQDRAVARPGDGASASCWARSRSARDRAAVALLGELGLGRRGPAACPGSCRWSRRSPGSGCGESWWPPPRCEEARPRGRAWRSSASPLSPRRPSPCAAAEPPARAGRDATGHDLRPDGHRRGAGAVPGRPRGGSGRRTSPRSVARLEARRGLEIALAGRPRAAHDRPAGRRQDAAGPDDPRACCRRSRTRPRCRSPSWPRRPGRGRSTSCAAGRRSEHPITRCPTRPWSAAART